MQDNLRWQTAWRSLTPAAIVVVAMVALVAGILFWSAAQNDRLAAERESAQVARFIASLRERVPRDQESVTIGDDAVLNTRVVFDPRWVDARLGSWMREHFHHDRAYVLDASDGPVYAITEDGVPGTGWDEATRGAALPLARLLRSRMDSDRFDESAPLIWRPAFTRGTPEQSIDGRQPREVDLVLLSGRPALVSVMPIVPQSAELRAAPGEEWLHVAVRFMDADLIARLMDRSLIQEARFAAAPPAADEERSLPLRSASGDTIGHLVWRPDRPGERFLKEIAPGLIAALLIVGGSLLVLLLRLRSSAAALRTCDAEARRLSLYDPLTGLANRVRLADRLEQALAAESRSTEVAVLYIDLDRFRSVNDTFGRADGDALLREFARRLLAVAGPDDTVARIGGDEFAVLLTGVHGVRFVEDVCAGIIGVARQPFELPGGEATVGVSIGYVMTPQPNAAGDDLLRRADIALYQAKRAGRGRFRPFVEPSDGSATPILRPRGSENLAARPLL